MPTAVNPKSEFEYVLKCDRELPEEERTVFVLCGLSVQQDRDLNDALLATTTGSNEMSWKSGTNVYRTLQHGLRGWRNFKDEDGEEVPFEVKNAASKIVKDSSLDRLRPEWRAELARAITARGEIGEDEED